MRRFVSFKRKEWAVLLVILSTVIDNSMLRWLRDDILHKFSYPDKLDIVNKGQTVKNEIVSKGLISQEYYLLLLVLTGLRSEKYLSVIENFDLDKVQDSLTNRSRLLNLLRKLSWIFDELEFHETNQQIRYVHNKEVDEVLEMSKKLFAVINKEEPDQSRPGS